MQSPFPRMQPGEHLNPVQFGSPGLAEEQAASNARIPHSVAPSTSGNGMSAGQYQQTLGGAFPVQNGIAKNQYDVAKFSMGKEQ